MEMLVRRLGVEGVICTGDDITDIDMFATLRRLRAQGLPAGRQGLGGASVAVASQEAAPEVTQAADYTVEGPEGIGWLLSEMVRALP